MTAPTCRRCSETVQPDNGYSGSDMQVLRICGCPDGPLWTDRPHMDQLLQQIRARQ